MPNKQRLFTAAAACALAVALGACGSSDDGDEPPAPAPAPPPPASEVPASASTVAGFVAFLVSLASSETAEPVVLQTYQPPVDDTGEPVAL